MTDFLNDAIENDYGIVDEQRGDGLPRLWWRHGNGQGFFYLRADGVEVSDGWTPSELHAGETGYEAKAAKIVPITMRAQPYVKDADGNRHFLAEWDRTITTGQQLLSEVLCVVHGVASPVVFSFHGATGTAMGSRRKPGTVFGIAAELYTAYIKAVVAKAKQQGKTVTVSQRQAQWSLWLPLAQQMERGKPKVVKTPQGSAIAPLHLAIGDGEIGRDLLARLYAGKDMPAQCLAIAEQYADWAKQRRGTEPVQTATPEETGRNAPQDYDDDVGF